MAQSRVEAILENMLGASNPLEPPQSRVEALLQELLEHGSGSMEAITSSEITTVVDSIS